MNLTEKDREMLYAIMAIGKRNVSMKQIASDIGMSYIVTITIKCTVLIIGPILFVAWFIAIMADFIQVGPLVATAPLMPKLDKLNPTKYFNPVFIILPNSFQSGKKVLE